MDILEVPQELARRDIDGQQAVSIAVVAGAIHAPEIIGGRPGAGVEDASRLIDRGF